jgi:hypothetical protein
MGKKRHQRRASPAGPRRFDGGADKSLVAEMNAIKRANGEDSG